jgi:tetratricopeptide (TPR) repeat protein
MNEKAASAQQKALQERKRGHFDKAIKRLEQAIVQSPDELDLYLDVVDACLEGGQVAQATTFLKTAQDKFPRERDRVAQFVRDKLLAVHDPALARFVVENAVKRRELMPALEHLEQIPDHVARDLLARTKTKRQSLRSASHGGYSLRSETLTAELFSALLMIRTDNLKDGTAALVGIVDEEPAELKSIAPFLVELEAKNPRAGRVRFANACALLAGNNEVEAIARFVEAGRLDSTAIVLCVERLQAQRDKTKFPGKVDRALAELLLLKEDFDAAAVVLRQYLADTKDSDREVILLLKPYIDPAHSTNECVWVALEAALSLDQSAAAMEILRPLHHRGKNTPEIYARLEEKSKSGSLLMPEIMLFHAAIALELKDFARGAEILNAVVAASPQDVHAVLGLADKHRSSHPDLEEICRKHMTAETVEAPPEEGDFQNFDNNEFSLGRAGGAPAAPRPSSPEPAGEKPPSRFAEDRKKPAEQASFVETRELSFDDDGTPAAPEPEAAADYPRDEIDTSMFETSRDLRLTPRTPASPSPPSDTPPRAPVRPTLNLSAEEPSVGVTESHVSNVAKRLGEAGASAFFHIDGDVESPAPATLAAAAPNQAPAAPAASADAKPVSADSPSPAPIDAVAYARTPTETPAATVISLPAAMDGEADAPPAAEPTFEDELARFRKGELDNARVIALIQRATEERRLDDLHDLLSFAPRDDAEKFAQRYYEAEYHALSGRPLPALDILARLGDHNLTDDQRRRLWFKMAVCQRSMNDFAAASDTLRRLTQAFPDQPEFARLARRNTEQLAEQAGDVPVLQKTTSLD